MQFNTPAIPRGIRGIIIASAVIWIVQLLPGIGTFITSQFSLVPFKAFGFGHLWQLVSYMFLHDPSGPFHILFNMFTLWMFGVEMELLWGTRRFVLFYIFSGICAGLFSLLTFASPLLWHTPVIGGSGAILALLTVYALTFPTRQILLFFIIPVNVVVAVVIFGAISVFGSLFSWGNVSHLTHLGGIVVGFLYVKTKPFMESFANNAKQKAELAQRQSIAKQEKKRQDYFENMVDPVLKKISKNGIDSLTIDEKLILEKAAELKQKQDEASGKILRFRR